MIGWSDKDMGFRFYIVWNGKPVSFPLPNGEMPWYTDLREYRR